MILHWVELNRREALGNILPLIWYDKIGYTKRCAKKQVLRVKMQYTVKEM